MTEPTTKLALNKTPITEGCILTATGAEFSESITYDQWSDAGMTLVGLEGCIQFAIGDWLNFGDMAFGEKCSQLLDHFSYKTMQNYAWICRKVKPENRIAGLSFKHHDVIAKLDDKDQKRFLDYASEKQGSVDGGYSAAEFRAYVKSELADDDDEPPIPHKTMDDYKNALSYIRTICKDAEYSMVPTKDEVAIMIESLSKIEKECIAMVGEK